MTGGGSAGHPGVEERLRFLAQAGRVLSSSLGYEATLGSVARLAVPIVADYCVIDVVEDDGSIRRVGTAHRDPDKEALAAQLRRFPPLPGRTRGVPVVLSTGRPEVVPAVDEAALHALAQRPEHLQLLRDLQLASYLIVPLTAREQNLGAITLGYAESGRRYGPDDLAVAEELASHAALALDNARLYRNAQAEIRERRQATDELDRKHHFLQLLLDVTTAANEAASAREAVWLALQRVRAHTRWPLGHAYLYHQSGCLESMGLWCTDEPERFAALRQATESITFAPGIGLPGRVLATGSAVAVSDVREDPGFLRTYLTQDTGVKAAFAFPVRVEDEIVAVLEFFSGRAIDLDAGFMDVMAHVGLQLGRVFERERARAALSDSEQRFRQLAENIREVFWIHAVDGGRSQLVYVSPGYEEIWGRPTAELYDEPERWLDAVHEEDRPRIEAALPSRPRGEYDETYRITRPDGVVRWIRDRGFPVRDESGVVVRVVGVAEDITPEQEALADRARLLQLEQEARASAEQAVRVQEEVLSMVSHDLKNPLNTIGMAAALAEEMQLEPDQLRRNLAIIRRTAEHMNRLVQGLLDLRRVEAGHGITVDPKRLPVQPLLEEGCRLFQPQADARGVSVRRDVRGAVPEVHADEERVLQVLWNLTGNAIKFTPDGGCVRLSAEANGAEVRFAVSDDGPGVPPDDLARLFDPFWQAKRTARLGTGLGLPISRAIIEAHGGRIWAESEPGRGSTFYFTLPAAREP